MRKKLLAALLSVCMIVSLMVVPAAAASTFDDVTADHWAASAIERWAGYEVLTGNGDGTFAPDRQMTRAEFASMLVNMLGLTKKSSSKFPDVPDNAWYADYISIAMEAGIITGDNGNAAPTRYVTFNEAAVMLCRALGLAKTNVSGADWAKESIEKLTEMGAIGGSDAHLQAGADCNRAVVAALADKIVEQYVDEDTTITGEVKGVVLVVKGAKADIKDATLSAPLVIESAEATLTNTKAQDVKVDGAKAAVTTDAASTVEAVTLAGDAPKADIKGTVASVVVAENATSAAVDVPASMADKVANNSSSAITVNGETQEPTKTDDSTTTSTVTEGSSDPAHVHEWIMTSTAEGHTRKCASCGTVDTTGEHTYAGLSAISAAKHAGTCSVCGYIDATGEAHTFPDEGDNQNICTGCGYNKTAATTPGNSAGVEGHTHDFESDQSPTTVNATCTSTGTITYHCQNDIDEQGTDCTATKVVTLPKTAHNYDVSNLAAANVKVVTQPTCGTAGSALVTCTNEGCTSQSSVVLEARGEHNYGATAAEYTYGKTTAEKHFKTCKVCGQTETTGETHTFTNGKCTVCNYVCKHTLVPDESAPAVEANCANNTPGRAQGKKCSLCGMKFEGALVAATHTFNTDEWSTNNTDHWHACTKANDGCTAVTDKVAHTFTYQSVDANQHQKKCSVCGQTEGQAENHDTEGTGGACSKCGYIAHTHSYEGATYTVDSGYATCSAACTSKTGTCDGTKDTKQHTSGTKCSFCDGTYWNNNGTWQDKDPDEQQDGGQNVG